MPSATDCLRKHPETPLLEVAHELHKAEAVTASDEDTLVLLVEDDPDLLELEQMQLESSGFLVVTARDGAHALRLLKVLQPDLIVTDLMMPVLDGFGLIKAYRERPDSNIPIIAVSSFEGYIEEARALGADAAMHKPLKIAALTEMIHALTRGREAPPQEPSLPEVAELETARLQEVLNLGLDKKAPEESLRVFIDAVARHFDAPIALLSVITAEEQFWSAACGLPKDLDTTRAAPRKESFCTHAVAARAALVVQDTIYNPFFRNNPWVTERGLRFYAGVPLFGTHGEAVGTLCLMDYRPRTFTHFDLELLTVFGNRVLAHLEWRERRRSPDIPPSSFRYLDYIDTELQVFGKLSFLEVARIEGARAAELNTSMACIVMSVPYERLAEIVDGLKEANPAGLVGRLGHARLGWIAPNLDVEPARERALEIAGPDACVEAVPLGQYANVLDLIGRMEASLGDKGIV